MDGVSSAAAIVQIMGNAINAAITTARFVNNVRNAEKFHNDFVDGLERSQSIVELMRKRLKLSDRDAGEVFQETKDIYKLVDEIAKDCDKCHDSLVRLYDTRTSNIIGRVAGEFKMEMRKPEIESVKTRLRTNVGNIQTLLSVLQFTSQEVSTVRMEDRLQEIHANIRCLPQLREEVIAALINLNNSQDYARGAESSELIDPICNEKALSWDATACLKITEDTLKTASSIYERLSRGGGSVHNASSLSENGPPDIPVPSPHDSASMMTTHLSSNGSLSMMTVFLDNYIQEMKTEFAKGDYEKSKKNLREALVWGERRYWEYKEEFYEWFDLQLRFVEIHEAEGKFQDAQNYIILLRKLSSAAEENAFEYQKISELQEMQLLCTNARLCLRGYRQEGDTYITLDRLEQEAVGAYGAATKAFRKALMTGEELSNTILQHLLVDSAKTLDKVFEIFEDPVGRRSLRVEYTMVREQLPALEPIVPSTPHGRRTPSVSNSPSMLVLRPPSTCGSSEAQSPTAGSTPITVHSARNTGEIFFGSPERFTDAPCYDASRSEEMNDAGQTTALITAVKSHDLELLKQICSSEEFDELNINAVDYAGMNALHHALTTMDGEDTVELLIANGIDVNASDGRGGDTPLHYCVRRSNYKAAKLLLRTKKVVIESVNKSNQTPAQLAIQQSGGIMSNTKMLKLLIKHKANFNWPGITREIRNNLRALGYDEKSFSSSLEEASSTASVTDRRPPPPREHRYSRSSQSSHSSQHSRWTQVIATISRNN